MNLKERATFAKNDANKAFTRRLILRKNIISAIDLFDLPGRKTIYCQRGLFRYNALRTL